MSDWLGRPENLMKGPGSLASLPRLFFESQRAHGDALIRSVLPFCRIKLDKRVDCFLENALCSHDIIDNNSNLLN